MNREEGGSREKEKRSGRAGEKREKEPLPAADIGSGWGGRGMVVGSDAKEMNERVRACLEESGKKEREGRECDMV